MEIYGQGLYQYDIPIIALGFKMADAVTLSLAIPLLILALVLYRRGSLRGGILLAGVLAYFLYNYSSLALGAAYNNLFLVYVAIMALSLFAFVIALGTFDPVALVTHFLPTLPQRAIGLYLIVSGAILLLLWLVLSIVPALLQRRSTPGSLELYDRDHLCARYGDHCAGPDCGGCVAAAPSAVWLPAVRNFACLYSHIGRQSDHGWHCADVAWRHHNGPICWDVGIVQRADALCPRLYRCTLAQFFAGGKRIIAMKRSTFMSIVTLFVLVLLYLTRLRPWQLRWGATDDEIKRAMPGDEIVDQSSFNATRAVTIQATAEQIYPWIVQMGVTRAGWYSYDLLDNLGRPSAESILPEHQKIQVGDLIPLSPDGKQGMRVKEFLQNRSMVWWDQKGDSSWAWGIYPEGEAASRLVTRVRVNYRLFSPAILFNLLVEFGDIVMMRKCMLGIKRHAEAMPLAIALTGKHSMVFQEREQ